MIQKLTALKIKNVSTIKGGTETQETTVNKAKMADKAMNAITQYISS
ncbi:hypothetical protein C8N46_11194 [Kordia periserrulae]|uniref:Uncharacterized protein n=1 Tax=Kordia periserrulae TaxID=701523 RepID=A0A2T6BSF1_9FLAO|nr:hypothetical protein [Kordia periserrulae]PTX59025.1 hypothetical protein C8N46_11194 [Kordia periserrulae]